MTRPYHSPSSIALGKRCPRAWAESYIAGKRDPDVDWSVIADWTWNAARGLYVGPTSSDTCTAKSRGAAIGKAMHATLERWYRPELGKPDWHWHPGQVAQAGLHMLPHPSRCTEIVTEEAIGDTPLPVRDDARPGSPTMALEIGGVRWAGFRDLLVQSPDELARMGIVSHDGWLLVDYKSSANILEYALTEQELLADPQANLYAIDVCAKHDLSSVPARWVYFASKKVRAAEPRDVTIELSRAHDIMGPCVELARELDTLTRVEDAPQNPLACEDYGPPGQINCEHHISKGGTCSPRRTAGALIAQLDRRKRATTEKKQMALSPEQQAKFKAMQDAKKLAASSAPATEPSDESKSEDAPDTSQGEEATTEIVAPVKPVVAPAKSAAKAPKGAVPGGTAATVAALAVELAATEKAIADATAAHAATLAKIRGAVA